MVKPGRRELCRTRGSGGSLESVSASDAGAVGWTPTMGGLRSLTVSSAVVVLLLGDAVVGSVVARSRARVSGLWSGPAPGASACADRFGGSAFAAFGAPSEPSEVESPPEGDGWSACAIPLAPPTATQADSKNAATISRNHQ